ncbi:phosphogluconate dehydratase [Aestuariirhabdus litorea]|uniref:Phosphogluconate dehydratase n=1 Tax=Aestuariirhabdus litorea TaxID=2528527 RepID=A0A3P3VI39_9GAMM|nr:phosphogluconate dehydratase [Aestuariirhabdus litorea]RRJ82395.1 phosphogluconate dehydratase [Aestuariirhabdus litorea]RWW92558.1 phosphogluconate dehydratase [Endozoicomonadaceae bacterium GTF-13]
MHAVVEQVTRDMIERSKPTRERYLQQMADARRSRPLRQELSCSNLAHAMAAAPGPDRIRLRQMDVPNIAIVSSYNDLLSAHQPLGEYPQQLKTAVASAGGTAQFAAGVPAMCDGVTQGQPGMELSLFSRDLIAMSTAVAMSHNLFDGLLCLGVCDKIVPGLLLGALRFGHLPALFVPAGPMSSGISNPEKAKVRQQYAEGKVDREALLEAETRAYHGEGTCTFFGTANSNQLLMEVMGLQLPGSAFVHPRDERREWLTRMAGERVVALSEAGSEPTPLWKVLDERSLVNGMVGLLASGGSTNHSLHLPAIAAAAGIDLRWEDFDRLSSVVPLLARIYPNGPADINAFQQAGGIPRLLQELGRGGLLHEEVSTVAGTGLEHYRRVPALVEGAFCWQPATGGNDDGEVLTSLERPFDAQGGLRLLQGNLGRAMIKVSAVVPSQRVVEAEARVFDDQHALERAFEAGELNRDLVAVVRFQGPVARGMPELHKLTPVLGVLQDRGYRVALVTDGRMSGASGKVPAAIHLCPEAARGGLLARVRDGDLIRVDCEHGELELLVDPDLLAAREPDPVPAVDPQGCGRELFTLFRRQASSADTGATQFPLDSF